ncbi:MAG: TonB-dependent siderophore receptor [Comamonas sp.]
MSQRCSQPAWHAPALLRPPFALKRSAAAHMALLMGLAMSTSGTLAQTSTATTAQDGANAPTLPAVTVREQSQNVTAPYAGGQVATGGRVGLLGDKDFMETPFSAISYTEEYIADRQAKDIGEVISATDPAVFSNNASGSWAENYSIRGFTVSSTDTSINGLYGMAPYYRGTTEMYDRVEVLKGPTALLNGMPPGGSVGGSINLQPKRAGDAPLTRLTGTYMSNAQFGTHLDMGRRFGENKQFGIRFNGVYRDGEGAVNQQDKKAELASLGLDWRSDRVRLSTDMYISEDRVNGVSRGLTLANNVSFVPKPPKADTLLSPDWGYVHNKDKAIMARGEFDLTDQVTAHIAVGSSKSNYAYNGAAGGQITNANTGAFTTTLAQLQFEVEKKSLDTGLKGRFQTGSVGHQWSLNATYYADTLRETGNRVTGTMTSTIYNPVWGPAPVMGGMPITHNESTLRSFGLADTLSFAKDRVQLTLGIRHQSVRTDNFNAVSGIVDPKKHYATSANTPAAALLVKATENLSVYANYIEGLSKGQQVPSPYANEGEMLAPYKTKQKEVGLKIDLGDFAHTLSVYQISKPSGAADVATNTYAVNGQQRNRGVEWGFFGTPVHGIRLMGGVAYSDPKVTKSIVAANVGKMAKGMPKLQAKLGVEWDTPVVQGLTLTANATAVSKQYIDDLNQKWASGRTTYDLGARYKTKVHNTPVVIRAAVNNVTNKAYWGMPALTSLILGAPRTVSVSASMDF